MKFLADILLERRDNQPNKKARLELIKSSARRMMLSKADSIQIISTVKASEEIPLELTAEEKDLCGIV